MRPPGADLVGALESIDAHRLGLESDGEIAKAIAPAIQRIDLRRDGFELTLDLKPLVCGPAYRAGRRASHDPAPGGATTRTTRRRVANRDAGRGRSRTRSKLDPLLLKAIVRGRRWFAELAANRAADTRELAKREGLHDSYIRRLIPLAFLAPSIVEAICSGRQPADLTVERLTRRAGLPYQWAKQQKALGLPRQFSELLIGRTDGEQALCRAFGKTFPK